MSSTKGLNPASGKENDEAEPPLFKAFPKLEAPELLDPLEGVELPPGVPVGVGVLPTVDVGEGEGAGDGVLVTVGVMGTGVCPTGVGCVPPPVPPLEPVGVVPGVEIVAGAVGPALPREAASSTISTVAT